MRRDAWTLIGLWCVGYLLWPVRAVRRWKLRRNLRHRLKSLGMIPVIACAWAGWEVAPIARAIAQAPADSLIGTVLSRSKIPADWQGDPIRVFCLTWTAEIPERPRVLVIIDAEPADTTQSPLCPKKGGGFYPLWIDGPVCPPGQVSPFNDRDFVLVRCGPNDISRYRRPQPTGKAL